MITLVILALTTAFSFYCMDRPELKYKYLFHPYSIKHFNQHYRFLSHAFVHADYFHLGFNMFALWMFGKSLETRFLPYLFDGNTFYAEVFYIFLYTGAIYASSISEYFKNKNNQSYSSLGASGAINAVMFSYILFNPTREFLFMMAIPMPAWLTGILVLGVSYYLSRRKQQGTYSDNIGHEAHFWGAVFGFVITGAMAPELVIEFFKKIFFWL